MNNNRVKLLLLNAENKAIKEFEITQPNTILGRSPEANIVIESTEISRLHAKLINSPSGFFICDLNSTNGTFLNGDLLESEQVFQLKANDRINLGEIVLLFQTISLPTNSNNPQANNIPEAFSSSSMGNQVEINMSKSLNNHSQAKPIYLPPSPSQEIYPISNHELPLKQFGDNNNLSAEEQKLAEEIFGQIRSKNNNSGENWNKMNLFRQKINAVQNNKSNFQSSLDIDEHELFSQVLGNAPKAPVQTINNIIEPNLTSAPFNQSYNQQMNQMLKETSHNLPVNYSSAPAPLVHQSQEISQIQTPNYKTDLESYYYPEANNSNTANFPLEAYSFNPSLQNQDKDKDPFEALMFKEDDSVFSKFKGSPKELFNEKLKINKTEEKPSLLAGLKNYAIPIGVLIIALIITLIFAITHRPAFG